MTPGQAIAGAIKRASESHARLVQVNRNSLPSTSAKQREQRAKSEADALEYVKALELARELVMELVAANRAMAVAQAAFDKAYPSATHTRQAVTPKHNDVVLIEWKAAKARLAAAVEALGEL